MKNIFNIMISILVISPYYIACTGIWHNPNTSVPSKELSIIDILVTPTLYDNAGVEVEGKVWDLYFESDKETKEKELYSFFKLADKDGNYIYVKSSSTLPAVAEGELVKVTGIHRLLYNPESNEFRNEIEAYSIKK